MECFKPASSSILNKTIPDILSISDNENNLISNSFERLFLSELDITSEAWNRLNYYCIYEGDTLDYILPLLISARTSFRGFSARTSLTLHFKKISRGPSCYHE